MELVKRTVLDMCPWAGLRYEMEGVEYYGGKGLSPKDNKRLDEYFARFHGQPFSRDRAIELAQMALDDVAIPDGWKPKE